VLDYAAEDSPPWNMGLPALSTEELTEQRNNWVEELSRDIGDDDEVWDMEGVSLKNPPPDDYHFDLESHTSQCIAALKFDPAIQRQRYRLVPSTGLTEEAFWRQYFHRLGLVPKEAGRRVAEAAVAGEADVGVKAISDAQ
jgi:hypothetical protein